MGVVILCAVTLAFRLHAHKKSVRTHQIEEPAKFDRRGHPDTKPEGNDVQHVGRELQQHVNDDSKPARYDPQEYCAEWEKDDESQTGNDSVRKAYSFRFLNVKSGESFKLAEASVSITGGTTTGPSTITAVATITITTVTSELGGTTLTCSCQFSKYNTEGEKCVSGNIHKLRSSNERVHDW